MSEKSCETEASAEIAGNLQAIYERVTFASQDHAGAAVAAADVDGDGIDDGYKIMQHASVKLFAFP